jgi:membrane-bound lytic murein transglycosylase D
MRFSLLALVALLLALTGCSQMDTRDDDSLASNSGEHKSEDIYRLPPTASKAKAEPTQHADYGLWTRLGHEFTLHTKDNERIDAEVFAYQGRIDQLHTTTKRAEPYLFFIVEQLRERGMPMELALLPIVESSYQPQATSRSQAAGLWQFMPSTGSQYGLKQNWWYDGRRDVQASTQAALDYLQYLNTMFNGDWALTLAAYNAGEGTVSRAIQRAEAKGQPTDYWSLDLPDETQHYVPRFLALARMFHDPESCGLTPHRVEDMPVFAQITFDKPLDLSKVASAVSMSEADLYRLNPGFKHGINGQGHDIVALLLPRDKAAQLQSLDMEDFCVTIEPPRLITLKKTESLASIAKRFGISQASIREVNPPLGNKLNRGQALLVPSNRMMVGQPSTQLADASPRVISDPLKVPAKERYAVTPKITHSVSTGDSLFSLSRKYGVKPDDIASWNKLSSHSALKPGQKLTLYCELPNAGIAKSAATTTKSASLPLTYTVKKGDTLHSIAKRFHVEVAQLRQWNKLKTDDTLSLGQNIIVALASKGSKSSS